MPLFCSDVSSSCCDDQSSQDIRWAGDKSGQDSPGFITEGGTASEGVGGELGESAGFAAAEGGGGRNPLQDPFGRKKGGAGEGGSDGEGGRRRRRYDAPRLHP